MEGLCGATVYRPIKTEVIKCRNGLWWVGGGRGGEKQEKTPAGEGTSKRNRLLIILYITGCELSLDVYFLPLHFSVF